MRLAKVADPSRSRGIAGESAVYSGFRRLAIAGLITLALLAALSPLSVTARSAPYMDWPTVGRETQPFGCTGFRMEPRRGDCAHFHAGIDIANSRGAPILAAAAGTVAYVGLEPWYHGTNRAWVVILSHGNGIKTIYVHLLRKSIPGIAKGKHVNQGQLIGRMGTSGRSTGYHLHFGVWLYGKGVDPTKYLPSTTAPRYW
jgi:murein DD-endopeptidase MepM/ murein hydrolase activator NlpD